MATILIAGFLHETNTFSKTPTTFVDFEQPDSAPGITFGENLFSVMRDVNIGISGFIEQARADGHTLIPSVWASACPSGIVTKEAFDAVCSMICDYVRNNAYDAIYLDLHGAMVTEDAQNAESELVSRIRSICGNDIPIVINLDLHANISQNLFELCDFIDVYRTYPHIDISDTGKRTARALNALLAHGTPFKKQCIKLPLLMGLNAQCTLIEPAKSIYEKVIAANTPECFAACALGFALADIFDAGPAIVTYAHDQKTADSIAIALSEYIIAHKEQFKLELLPADEAVLRAINIATDAKKPVIISDTQDNPGGGASSDTTGLLKALVAHNARNAVIGILHDPVACAHAHEIGRDNEMLAELGGRSGALHDTPFKGKCVVKALSNGQFRATGDYYKGINFDLGAMAVLSIDGIDIVISTRKMQAADPAIFTHIGIDPTKKSIVALKSSVHFRAAFTDMAECILTAIAPGLCTANILTLDYKNIASDTQILS
jgi:microcystin degradation protein MlrC